MIWLKRVGLALLGLGCGLLLAGSVGAATLEVSWDANTEEDLAGYKVYYGTAPRAYGRPVVVDAGATSCQLTGLADGVAYHIAVTAFDTSANESGFSEEVSATTGDQTAPLAPRGVKAAVPAPPASGLSNQ